MDDGDDDTDDDDTDDDLTWILISKVITICQLAHTRFVISEHDA